jgi:hypothetical protein
VSREGRVLAESESEPSAIIAPGCQTLWKLTLSYPNESSCVLEGHLDDISEILRMLGDEVDIMMGFDILPADTHVEYEEDLDFFTGISRIFLMTLLTFHSQTTNCLD